MASKNNGITIQPHLHPGNTMEYPQNPASTLILGSSGRVVMQQDGPPPQHVVSDPYSTPAPFMPSPLPTNHPSSLAHHWFDYSDPKNIEAMAPDARYEQEALILHLYQGIKRTQAVVGLLAVAMGALIVMLLLK